MRSQSNDLDEIREAIFKAFQGPYGEKVMGFLEDMYCNSISAEPNDPYTTYFNEGGRGLVLGLKSQIKAYSENGGNPKQPEWSEIA